MRRSISRPIPQPADHGLKVRAHGIPHDVQAQFLGTTEVQFWREGEEEDGDNVMVALGEVSA